MFDRIGGVFVEYCPVCSLPFEYCKWGGKYDECVEWAKKNNKSDHLAGAIEDVEVSGKKKEHSKQQTKSGNRTRSHGSERIDMKEGDKLLPGGKVVKAAVKEILIIRLNRGKKKSITDLQGLDKFGIKLKDAAKIFSGKFACGASVKNVCEDPAVGDHILIQGDVSWDLPDLLLEKFGDKVKKEDMYYMDDKTKKKESVIDDM